MDLFSSKPYTIKRCCRIQTMKHISCHYCSSSHTKMYLPVDGVYALYICTACSLVFTHPRPRLAAIGHVNDQKYDSDDEKESRLAMYEKEYTRAKNHVLEIQKYVVSGTLLDIGCSYGICVKAANDLGFDASGIEPARHAAAYAKKVLHVHVFQTTIQKAHIKSNSFDVITLYDVLEHIPDIKSFLKEIRRILKPNGLLVVQSPNIESFAARILKTRWNWLLIPHHLWHFTPTSLLRVLINEKFTVIDTLTEDNVFDFSSNYKSTIALPIFSSGIIFKIIRKLIAMSAFLIIRVGTHVWAPLGKGGIIRMYARKN